MALSVPAPVRWISAITARVVALALLACSDLAARALPIVSAPAEMVASSALAVASLAAQSLADVSRSRTLPGPLGFDAMAVFLPVESI
jgi:hypothetical protein